MTQEETDKIFNAITSNGCRDMDEIRFNQAVNEILGQSEQFYCQTEHEVGGGRCEKCCNPDGVCYFKKQ